jgi:hypothetical protein
MGELSLEESEIGVLGQLQADVTTSLGHQRHLPWFGLA